MVVPRFDAGQAALKNQIMVEFAAHMLIGQMFNSLLSLIVFVLTFCHVNDLHPCRRKHA